MFEQKLDSAQCQKFPVVDSGSDRATTPEKFRADYSPIALEGTLLLAAEIPRHRARPIAR